MSRDVLNAGLASLGLALSDAQVMQLLVDLKEKQNL